MSNISDHVPVFLDVEWPSPKSTNIFDTITYHIPIPLFFSKVFEKTMYNHLINFIDANTILYKYQFGFRKSHSTNHARISLAEKVSNAMDSGKISIGVFLDLRKAFDTVDHCILLEKLYKYGIRGTPWNWFKSYLEIGNNMYATVILYLQPCQ